MTLPPERITVKRRRDEDPVEALYIQSKKQRPSVVWTLQGRLNHVSQPIPQPTAALPEKTSTRNIDLSGAYTPTSSNPSLLTNTRQERSDNIQLFQKPEGSSPPQRATAEPAASQPYISRSSWLYDEGKITRTADPRLRRFHLSHDSLTGLKHQLSFTGGIRKHRKPQRDHLAVFVETEKGERLVEQSIRAHEQQGPNKFEVQDDRVKARSIEAGTAIRKRPNAGAVERAWRAETWGRRTGDDADDKCENGKQPSTNWDRTSLGLAEELQEFSIEQSRAQTEHPQTVPNPQIKFKPKPPRPRQTRENIMVDSVRSDPAIRSTLDEDGDYIVDTYIRASLQPTNINASSLTYVDPLRGLERSKVGILVIEKEEEALWEGFADEQQIETECASDEEDENAEDFYGNDYPEDEVDDDDGYDKGSYDYRNNASDDEEYNSDEPEWSDGEDQPRQRWG